MNIVSFSGGKDSTAMLLMLLENNVRIDRIINIDTTKEFPSMYKHIEKVQSICSVKIETVKINFDYLFAEHVKTRGKIGEVVYGWPSMLNRWCTTYKTQTLDKLKNKDDISFIGISIDEKHRVKKKNNFVYPLIEYNMTGRKALEYCYSKGFDWDGLYDKMSRVSCWCCPLVSLSELKVLYKEFPDLWKELIEMDSKTHRKFRKDYSVKDLSEKFKIELLSEKGLFNLSEYNLKVCKRY